MFEELALGKFNYSLLFCEINIVNLNINVNRLNYDVGVDIYNPVV